MNLIVTRAVFKKTCWLMIAIIGLLLIGNCTSSPDQSTSAAKEASFSKMTAAEHLAAAKAFLDKPSLPMGEIIMAKKHLEAIKDGDKEAAEAKRLLEEEKKREAEMAKTIKKQRAEIIKEDKKRQAETAKIARPLMIKQRKEFADALEREYLKKGMDIYIMLSGPDKTTIKLSYVLMSRPLAYQLMTEGDFATSLTNMGFKKLILNNGYDFIVSYNLER